jgi:hypothetical protein
VFCGGEVLVAVACRGVLVRCGFTTTGVSLGTGLGVLVGVPAAATTEVAAGSRVLITGVLLGPPISERGVTVGCAVMSALPGVLVGAFWGAAITITSSVGMLPTAAEVGPRVACAVSVARSAAAAAAAAGAIGGRIWIFHGL